MDNKNDCIFKDFDECIEEKLPLKFRWKNFTYTLPPEASLLYVMQLQRATLSTSVDDYIKVFEEAFGVEQANRFIESGVSNIQAMKIMAWINEQWGIVDSDDSLKNAETPAQQENS